MGGYLDDRLHWALQDQERHLNHGAKAPRPLSALQTHISDSLLTFILI